MWIMRILKGKCPNCVLLIKIEMLCRYLVMRDAISSIIQRERQISRLPTYPPLVTYHTLQHLFVLCLLSCFCFQSLSEKNVQKRNLVFTSNNSNYFEFFHSTVFTRDFSSRVLMAQSTGLSATLDVAVIQRIKCLLTHILEYFNIKE